MRSNCDDLDARCLHVHVIIFFSGEVKVDESLFQEMDDLDLDDEDLE